MYAPPHVGKNGWGDCVGIGTSKWNKISHDLQLVRHPGAIWDHISQARNSRALWLAVWTRTGVMKADTMPFRRMDRLTKRKIGRRPLGSGRCETRLQVWYIRRSFPWVQKSCFPHALRKARGSGAFMRWSIGCAHIPWDHCSRVHAHFRLHDPLRQANRRAP